MVSGSGSTSGPPQATFRHSHLKPFPPIAPAEAGFYSGSPSWAKMKDRVYYDKRGKGKS